MQRLENPALVEEKEARTREETATIKEGTAMNKVLRWELTKMIFIGVGIFFVFGPPKCAHGARGQSQ